MHKGPIQGLTCIRRVFDVSPERLLICDLTLLQLRETDRTRVCCETASWPLLRAWNIRFRDVSDLRSIADLLWNAYIASKVEEG